MSDLKKAYFRGFGFGLEGLAMLLLTGLLNGAPPYHYYAGYPVVFGLLALYYAGSNRKSFFIDMQYGLVVCLPPILYWTPFIILRPEWNIAKIQPLFLTLVVSILSACVSSWYMKKRAGG